MNYEAEIRILMQQQDALTRIKKASELLNLRQTDIQRLLGVQAGTLSKWWHGHRVPNGITRPRLLELADALEIVAKERS